ncbi:DNA internalization-related competence protein ComEC/Rec2 [bacterium]|nr:DNA internalization-related competence protein ComEC/Rec2 [bacterium]
MKNQPALKTSLILIAGMYLGHSFPISVWIILILCTALTLITTILLIFRREGLFLECLLTLSLVSLGCMRYLQVIQTDPQNHIRFLYQSDQPLTIQGFLKTDPEEKSNSIEWILNSEKLMLSDTTISITGPVLVTMDTEIPPILQYGDVVQITGECQLPNDQRNPGGFDYREYLTRKKIYRIMRIDRADQVQHMGIKKGNFFLREIIYPMRRFTIEMVDRTTEEPNRSLLKALLVGERGTISPEVRESFEKAGVIHVLAVSGLHVGFVLFILMTILRLLRLAYPIRVLLTILGLLLYALITEMRTPVTRATIMAITYLIGTRIERRIDPFNIIGIGGLVVLLFNPQELFDIGFQLSFTAVISIVYFYKKLSTFPWILKINHHLSNKLIGSYGLTLFLVSLSAQMGTIPLTAYYFNRIPLLSLIVNLFAIPLVGLIVALGLTTVITGLISLWVATIYGTLNEAVMSIYTAIIAWIGNLPFSHIYVPTPNLFHLLVYFSCVLLLIYNQNKVRRKQFAFIFMISLNLLAWKNIVWNQDSKITWIQFDVGQGDAALLHLPRGKHMLIDGGDKTALYDHGESVIAPYLRRKGIRSLDTVILTHPHNDHIGGLIYILNHFNVKQVITAGTPFESQLVQEFQNTIERKRIPMRTVLAPDSLIAFPGVKIYFLSPTEITAIHNDSRDINNQSLVMKVLFGKTRFLFMGDAEREAEANMIDLPTSLSCDVIKVGHHGSGTSSTLSFLNRANPAHAVISVGKYNLHGHPSETVLLRFEMLGTTVHRTDQEGAVIFRSDGEILTKVNWK